MHYNFYSTSLQRRIKNLFSGSQFRLARPLGKLVSPIARLRVGPSALWSKTEHISLCSTPIIWTTQLYSIIMGWLPWGSSEPEGVKKTSGGAFESPSRTNRAKCYETRDAFFECLDRNNILDSINTKNGRENAKKACGQEATGRELPKGADDQED